MSRRYRPSARLVSLLVSATLAISCVEAAETYAYGTDDSYVVVCAPECDANVTITSQNDAGGVSLFGGVQYYNEGAEDAFQWLGDQGGGTNMVVLKVIDYASTTTTPLVDLCSFYNDYVYGQLGAVASMKTICFLDPSAAFETTVFQIINNAGSVYFSGGNQWNYVSWWNNTYVTDAIRGLETRPAAFGGSSAGLAILGEYLYTAEYCGATSSEALLDPYDECVTLGEGFLHMAHMENKITDTHFLARDRMGRLVTFLARLLTDGLAHDGVVYGVGVNEETGLLLDQESGEARMVGAGPAYFLRMTESDVKRCRPGESLHTEPFLVYRINSTDASFNFDTWTGTNVVAYEMRADGHGKLQTNQTDGSIY